MKGKFSVAALCAFAAALSAFSAVSDEYAKTFALTVNYDGADISGMPVPVRLSESSIMGFRYADFRSEDGWDLAFADADGNVLPHDIERWDTSGTSLVWVKPATLARDSKIHVYYSSFAAPAEPSAEVAKSVWSAYLAVWHFDGSLTDATGLGATISIQSTSETTLSTAGRFGSCYHFSNNYKAGLRVPNVLTNASGNALSTFTISSWINHPEFDATANERIFSSKGSYGDNGFEYMFTKTKILARGNGSSTTYAQAAGATAKIPIDTWMHLAVVYDGSEASDYFDGALNGAGAIAKVTGKQSVGLGNTGGSATFGSGTSQNNLRGYLDEVRFRASASSAAWLAAERATAGDSFLTYGPVSTLDATIPALTENPTVTVTDDGAVVISGKIGSGSGDLYVSADGGARTLVASGVAAGDTFEKALAGLSAGAFHTVALYGVSGSDESCLAEVTALTASVTVTRIADADENTMSNGVFRLARPATEAAMAEDLKVAYTIGGTAVMRVNYEDLASTAVITSGTAYVDIPVVPLYDDSLSDTAVVLTLVPGAYQVGTPSSATVAVKDFLSNLDDDTCLWAAPASGDASAVTNWYGGRMPTKATDRVLVDGRVSSANMTYDGGVNGLSATLASWEQRANVGDMRVYPLTKYPDVDGAAFTTLEITGDCRVLRGYWTSQVNAKSRVWRLCVKVGGDLTIGESANESGRAKFTAYNCGYSQAYPSGSQYGSHAASADGWEFVYGDVYRPTELGAGSQGGSSGGGAIWLEVGGNLFLNGGMLDAGYPVWNGQNAAGGSVFVKAKSITGTGVISVSGNNPSSDESMRGAGGRIGIELTEATELGIGYGNLRIYGLCGLRSVGGGTAVVKYPGQTYGTLVLDNGRPGKSSTVQWLYPEATTAICPGATWTFDAIVIRRAGALAVPPGTKLVLPNGPGSIAAQPGNDATKRLGGIFYAGGAIDWGVAAPWNFSGDWTFQAATNYTFAGDVVLTNGAAIGLLPFRGNCTNRFTVCDVTVDGNLTVADGSYVWARFGSPEEDAPDGLVGAHGGQAACITDFAAYDSVFSPRRPGGCGALAGGSSWASLTAGGGVVKLVVTGALALDGIADARALKNKSNYAVAGAGGALDITCGRLSGAGQILANVFTQTISAKETPFVVGGGGRIAIRLTDQDVGSDGIFSRITAKGGFCVQDGVERPAYGSSAGTVYLQGKSDAERGGRIVIDNGGRAANNVAFTAFPGTGDASDAPSEFRRATLSVSGAARVKLTDDLRLRGLELVDGVSLDLVGRTVTVRRATVNGARLKSGVYTPSSASLAGLLADSASGGSLVVVGDGTQLTVR